MNIPTPSWQAVDAIIPSGFRWDGASDPLRPLYPLFYSNTTQTDINGIAAKVHDFGYTVAPLTDLPTVRNGIDTPLGMMDREDWDVVYRDALRHLDVQVRPWLRRFVRDVPQLHYRMLRKFGQRAWDGHAAKLRERGIYTYQQWLDAGMPRP